MAGGIKGLISVKLEDAEDLECACQPADVDTNIITSTTVAGGADDITTGSGDDVVIGGRANDTLRIGEGNNITFDDSAELTTILGGEAGETFHLGQQANNIIYGGSGDDDLIGGHNVTG